MPPTHHANNGEHGREPQRGEVLEETQRQEHDSGEEHNDEPLLGEERVGRHAHGDEGNAQEVAECIKKASEASKREMVKVDITENTIPHRVVGEHGGGRVLLRPASPGTGLIAGGGVRAVVEAAGIKDVLAKSLGSKNPANVIKATLNALEQLRSKEEIYSLRGKKLAEKKSI